MGHIIAEDSRGGYCLACGERAEFVEINLNLWAMEFSSSECKRPRRASIVRRIWKYLTIGVLFASSIQAQDKLIWAYGASSTADLVSSIGKREINPVLGRGQFGPKQAVTSIALRSAVVVLWCKYPRTRRWLKWPVVALTVSNTAVAISNTR